MANELPELSEEAVYNQGLDRLKAIRTPGSPAQGIQDPFEQLGISPPPVSRKSATRDPFEQLGIKPPAKAARTTDRRKSAQRSRELAQERQAKAKKLVLESQIPSGGRIVYKEAPASKQFALARLDSSQDMYEYIGNESNGVIPEGAIPKILKTKSGDDVPGYMLPRDPNFYALNKPGPSRGDIGYGIGSVANLETAAGIASAIPQTAVPARLASIPGRIGSMIKGGYSAGATAAREATGSALGRLGDETLDVGTGIQEDFEGLPSKLKQSATLGAISSGVGQVGEKLAKGTRSAMQPAPGAHLGPARAYVQAANRMGVDNVGVGDLRISNFWNKVKAARVKLSSEHKAKEQTKRAATINYFQKSLQDAGARGDIPLADDGFIDYEWFSKNITPGKIDEIAQNYQGEVDLALRKELRQAGAKVATKKPQDAGGKAFEGAGRSVLDSFYQTAGYLDIKSKQVSKAYSDAEKIARQNQTVYKLTGLKDKLKNLDKEIKVIRETEDPAVPRTTTLILDQAGVSYIQDAKVKSILNDLSTLSEQQKFYFGGPKGRLVERDSGKVMQDLINYRSVLGDLVTEHRLNGVANSVDGRAASALYGIISEALESAPGGAGAAWKKANRLHKEKMDTIDAFKFGELANNSAVLSKGEDAFNHIRPDLDKMTLERIKTLETIMNAKKKGNFDRFKGAYYESLLKNIPRTVSRLDDLSPAERYMLPADIQGKFREANLQIKKNGHFVDKMIEARNDQSLALKKILSDIPASEAPNVMKKLKYPMKVYHNHIISDLARKSIDLDSSGIPTMNPAVFTNEVARMRADGRYQALPDKLKRLVDDGDAFERLARSGQDIAGMLNIGAIDAARTELFKPETAAMGMMEARWYMLLGFLAERKSLVDRALNPPDLTQPMPKLRASLSGVIDVIQASGRDKEPL